jgi:hypothetical protein
LAGNALLFAAMLVFFSAPEWFHRCCRRFRHCLHRAGPWCPFADALPRPRHADRQRSNSRVACHAGRPAPLLAYAIVVGAAMYSPPCSLTELLPQLVVANSWMEGTVAAIVLSHHRRCADQPQLAEGILVAWVSAG